MIGQKMAQDITFEMSTMAAQIQKTIDYLASHDVAEGDINPNQLKTNVGRLSNVKEELLGWSRTLATKLD